MKHLYTLSFVKRSARGALDRKTVGSFLKISFSRHPHEIFAKCARAYTPVRRLRWENKIKRIFSVSPSLTLCFDSAPWLWFGRSRIFDLHKNYRLFCNLGERTLSIFFNFFFSDFHREARQRRESCNSIYSGICTNRLSNNSTLRMANSLKS